MRFDEVPAKTAPPLVGKKYPRYIDLAQNSVKQGMHTVYPDGSRCFDDLVSVINMSTGEDSPLITVRGGLLLHQMAGETQIHFEDGYLTPPHKHNFFELAYIMEGQLHKQIEGKDYIFNQGEFFFLNQGINHGEYYYQKKAAVIWLRLSNAFFDKSMNHSNITLADKKTEDFLRCFILNRNPDYYFVRFTPRDTSTFTGTNRERIPFYYETILSELSQPQPGSAHIVIGLVERILGLLSLDYQVSVERKDRKVAEKDLFEKIRFLLEDCYEDVSLQELIAAFGHDIYYFNRLIKRHTGMTYSAFLQNIRLEKAELLLKTTEYPVEEIARNVGYENVSYFYKIFTQKFLMKPSDMRKTAAAQTS